MSVGAIGPSTGYYRPQPRSDRGEGCGECSGEGRNASQGGQELDENEQKEVAELKATDAEVRSHEAAHMAAGGQYAGGASFEYQTGPDGRRYAVGGEVPIDTSAVPGDPQATINKMQVVRRAALAPAQPSGQDRAVAGAASSAEAKARQELSKERASGGTGAGEEAEKVAGPQSDRFSTYDVGARSKKLESGRINLFA